MWASAGQDFFNNELAALQGAMSAHPNIASSVIGLSVGSEDLYRISPTGIAGNDGVGAGPDVITSYISQVRSALAGTALSGIPIGHVDTWTAWVNGSNDAVIAAVDFIGTDAYPYFQNTVDNSIQNANATFFEAYYNTTAVAGGKPVWITETGWPVSGPTENLAVPSIANAQTYWDQVACTVLGNINTFWYTLQDAAPTTPSPSFGLVGSTLTTTPLYNLTCPAAGSVVASSSSSSSGAATSSAASAASASTSIASSVGASAIASAQSGLTSVAGSGPIVISAESSAAAPATTIVTPVPVSATVYSTAEVTVTACASSISSCPARTTMTSIPISVTTYMSSSTVVIGGGVAPSGTAASSAGPGFVTSVVVVPGNQTVNPGGPATPTTPPTAISTFHGAAATAAGSLGGMIGLALAVAVAL